MEMTQYAVRTNLKEQGGLDGTITAAAAMTTTLHATTWFSRSLASWLLLLSEDYSSKIRFICTDQSDLPRHDPRNLIGVAVSAPQ